MSEGEACDGMCRERLERTFMVNIIGMFSLAQKAVKHMVERGSGNIINIASIQAYKPSPPILDYSCTKVMPSSFIGILLGGEKV